MSDLKINNITDRTGDSGPVFAGISTVSSGQFVVPVGPTEYRGGRGRGVFVGGYVTPSYSNQMCFVEIATTGNAIDFGDLPFSKGGVPTCASSTRGIWAGGYAYPGNTRLTSIDYVTIPSKGGVTDFGDIRTASYGAAGSCSNGHGGLG